jgi:hypothetical protein
VRGEKPLEELLGIHRPGVGDALEESREPREQEEDERYGREQAVERERAGEKRDVVLVGGL